MLDLPIAQAMKSNAKRSALAPMHFRKVGKRSSSTNIDHALVQDQQQ